MSWEHGFVIDRDPTLRKRVDCRDCIHYEKSDRSCNKRGFYHPTDGYFHWKTCADFMLDSNSFDKAKKVVKQRGIKYIPEKIRHLF